MKAIAISSCQQCCQFFSTLYLKGKAKKQSLLFVAFLFLGIFSLNAQTFNGTGGAIPDNSCNSNHEFDVSVNGVGILGGLVSLEQVSLDITHPYDGDLEMSLISPEGTTIALSFDNGGSDNNYTNTNFRSDAPQTIDTATAPFTGNFIPEETFFNFLGEDANGTWTLRVCDDGNQDVGILNSWSIKFSNTSFVGNPDLIPQNCGDFKVILVLDESGSIESEGAEQTVRDAAEALADGLIDSGAELAVIEFASLADIIDIDGAGTDYGAGFEIVDQDFADDFENYLNSPPGTANYNPNSTEANGGWTNWQDALQKVLDLDTANLVLFVTDGNPTAVVNAGGACPTDCDNSPQVVGSCDSCNAGYALAPAIVNANLIKAEGAHMFVLGVGGNINEGNIIAITDSDKDLCPENDAICQMAFPEDPDFASADYALIPFTELQQCLTQLVTTACNSAILLNKTVAQGHDNCAGSSELVTGPIATDVTYCFEVENTGDGILEFVRFQDSDIGVDFITIGNFLSGVTVTSGSWPLDPNEVITFYINSSISGDLLNIATVTGEVLGEDPVSDSDTAEVKTPEGTPFDCEAAFYQVVSGQLKVFDPATSSYTDVGPDHDNINAIGYNVEDNFIYGLDKTDNQTLVRLDANGVKTDVGTITGGPFSPSANFFSADFDHSGNLYMYNDSNGFIKMDVSVSPPVAQVMTTTVTGGGALPSNADIAYNPDDGKFYGIVDGGDELLIIEITGATTATISTIALSGDILDGNGQFGAAWATLTGELFASSNTLAKFYQIDIDTGGTVEVASTLVTSNNDGANCSNADDPLPCSVGVNATPSECDANGNYDLAIQIIYNNPSGTNFTLVVNGSSVTYDYADYTSGHIFNLQDIVGDGTTGIEISITDNGSTDCESTITFDEPNCCVPLVINCPDEVVLEECSTEAEVLAAYTNWVADFTITGGINQTSNIADIPALPDFTCGGGISLSFDLSVTDDCVTSPLTCSSTFMVAVSTPLSVSCSADVNLPACSTEAEILAAYTTWAAGFTVNDGCNTDSNIAQIPALPTFVCGGGLDFSFELSATDDCNTVPLTCSASFTVAASIPLAIDCPTDVNLPSCSTEAEILTAYTTWAAGFTVNDGCNTDSNLAQIPTLPAFVCGGGLDFSFELSATDDCNATALTCSASFTVAAADDLVINDVQDLSVEACDFEDQAALDAAFANWLAGFGYTGGCDVTASGLDGLSAPDLCAQGDGGGGDPQTFDDSALGLGDIAFSAYSADNIGASTEDAFTIVLLRSVASGVQVGFTENGWFAAGGFRSNENSMVLEFGSDYAAGTQIVVSRLPFEAVDQDGNNAGIVTGAGLSLATGGDQIFAYDPANIPTAGNETGFVAAIQMNSAWDADATSSTTSAQPSEFIDGMNSISIVPEVDNARIAAFNCNNYSDIATLRTMLNTASNWETNDTSPFEQRPPLCNFVEDSGSGSDPMVSVTYTVTGQCDNGEDVATFTLKPSTELTTSCPDAVSLGSSTTEQEIQDAYDAWVAGFVVSGGCNPTTNIADIPALPDFVCGTAINLSFTLEASDRCNVDGQECSSTFMVEGVVGLTVTCPEPVSLDACATEAEVLAAYTAWAAGFIVNDGDNPTSNILDIPALPVFECGAGVALDFTLMASDVCTPNGASCMSSFTVAASTPLSVSCPAPVALDECSTEAEILAAYTAWASGFAVNDGCNADSNIAQIPALPTFECGAGVSLSFELSATDDCTTATCSSTFTVAASTPLSVSCPAPIMLGADATEQEISDAYALWVSGFAVNDGCNADSNIAQIPALLSFDCGSAVSLSFMLSATDDCGTVDCTSTFMVEGATPLMVDCPDDPNLSSCATQDEIEAAYATWISDFSNSGGINTMTNSADIPALPTFECGVGVNLSFTYEATDACGSASCMSTFTVAASTPLSVSCPAPVELDADATEGEILAAYTAWASGFTVNDGCNADSNIAQIPALPAFECGAGVSLSFELSATDDCTIEMCSSTFTVETSIPLSVDCPSAVVLDSCATEQEIQDAYTTWVAGFVSLNGINPTTNIDELPALPDYECGGLVDLSFDFEASDVCNTESCSSTFLVKEASELITTCPTDPNLDSCSTEQEISDAYDAWVAGFMVSGGCNDTSSNIADIPALPAFECGVGISLSFTLEAIDACNTASCSSTFTVGNTDPLVIDCPSDVSLDSPISQQGIQDAYDAWVAGFIVSGGCDDANSNINDIPELPEYVCGESIDLTFTLIATDSCNPNGITCSSTFNVDKTDAVYAGEDGELLICGDATVTAQDLFDALVGDADEGGTWNPVPDGVGIYTYTVEGSDPCPDDSATVEVTEEVIVITAGETVCGEVNDFGTYSVDISTNGGMLSSSDGDVIDNGGNSWSIINIPNNIDITATVTTDIGCQDSIVIEAPDCVCIELDWEYTNVTCFEEDDATVTVNFVTEGAIVTINGVLYDADALYPPGDYIIEAYFEGNDIAECYISEEFEILEPEPVTMTVSFTDVTCNGADDGTITVSGLSENAVYVIQRNGIGADLSGQDSFGSGYYIVTATVSEEFIENRAYSPCVKVVAVTISEPKEAYTCIIEPGFEKYPNCKIPEMNYYVANMSDDGIVYQYQWTIEDGTQNGWSIIGDSTNDTVYFEIGTDVMAISLTATTPDGCEVYCYDKVFSNCDNEKSLDSINAYPNPVKDILNVDFGKTLDSDTEIEVFDLVGNRVYSNSLSKNLKTNTMQIDFSRFLSNVYYLKISNRDGSIIKKVILDK